MPANVWQVDFWMMYARIRSGEDEHARKGTFLDVLKREYMEDSNFVRGHAKNSDFRNAHGSIFYDTRSNAGEMRLTSAFTRFRRILSAWVDSSFAFPHHIEKHSSTAFLKVCRGLAGKRREGKRRKDVDRRFSCFSLIGHSFDQTRLSLCVSYDVNHESWTYLYRQDHDKVTLRWSFISIQLDLGASPAKPSTKTKAY